MKGNITVGCDEIIGDRKNILKWILISSLKTPLSGDQIVEPVTRFSRGRDLSKGSVLRFGIAGNNRNRFQNQLIRQMLEFCIVILLFKIQLSLFGNKLSEWKYLIGQGDKYDKVGCAFAMVVVSLLPLEEFGLNDHQKSAPHCIWDIRLWLLVP